MAVDAESFAADGEIFEDCVVELLLTLVTEAFEMVAMPEVYDEIDLTLLIIGSLLLLVTDNEGDDVITADGLFVTPAVGEFRLITRFIAVNEGKLVLFVAFELSAVWRVEDVFKRFMFDLATAAAAVCLAKVEACWFVRPGFAVVKLLAVLPTLLTFVIVKPVAVFVDVFVVGMLTMVVDLCKGGTELPLVLLVFVGFLLFAIFSLANKLF